MSHEFVDLCGCNRVVAAFYKIGTRIPYILIIYSKCTADMYSL